MCRWYQVDDAHCVGARGGQFFYYQVSELLDGCKHLVYLCGRVGLGLQIVVHQRGLYLLNKQQQCSVLLLTGGCLSVNILLQRALGLLCAFYFSLQRGLWGGGVEYLLYFLTCLCQCKTCLCHSCLSVFVVITLVY